MDKSSGSPAPHKKAAGRKKGHAGMSHSRRPTRTEHHKQDRCPRCGNTEMEYGHPISKTVTDLVSLPKIETVQHVSYPATCCGCGYRKEPDEPGIRGTELGPNLASYITGLHSMPGSLGSVRTVLSEIFGLSVSRAAVLNCLQAVSETLEPDAVDIENDLSGSDSIHMDETAMMIDGKQGCIWIAVGKKDGRAHAVKVLVSGSGGGAVIDLHFPYGHVPATVDGKTMYVSRFPVLQRCWSHILRDARFEGANSMDCHRLYVKLKELYYSAKLLEPDPGNKKRYHALTEEAQQVANEYIAIGCRFGKKLDRAVPYLFTFLLYTDMEPTNNLAERSLRPSVISRKIRHSLKTPYGMRMFGMLMTCIMTWRARGYNVPLMIRNRLLGSMDALVGA